MELKNEIVLTLKENKSDKAIISNIPLLSEVIIDGKNMDISPTNWYELTPYVHAIIIKWDSPLTKCTNMFFDNNNLLTIDFSNFDSSQINDMESMFHGCINLKSINFNNFNTSSV